MKHKLTVGYVRNLPFTENRTEVYDTELSGFGLRVSAIKKTFFVRKRVGGKMTRVNIGGHDLMNADTARKRAMEALLKLSDGVDVNREKRRSQERGATLESVIESFFVARTNLKPKTEQSYRTLMRLYLSDWYNKPMADITPEMCAKRHLKIGNDHGKASADNCLRTFKVFYNFAKTIEDLPDNPVKRLSDSRQWYKVGRRETVISPSDLPAWYEAVTCLENPIAKNFLLLCLFTGLRRGEAASLKWETVNFEAGVFTVTDTKNGKPHMVPISGAISEILQEQAEIRENAFVFPGTGKAGYINNPVRQMKNITKKTGISFCVHDLRRTFGSIAEDIVSYTVLKRLMNHKTNDVTQGYLILSQDKMKAEMEAVSRAILNLCEPPDNGKVIPIRKV